MPVELQTVVESADDIGFSASVAKGLREQIHAAGVQATREIFEGDVLPDAKANSPVLTGKNRDSIAVSFRDKLDSGWISAWLYTESGYGWLIEHGTSHNRTLTRTRISKRHGQRATADRTPAHPYLYPAMRFCAQIADRARQILEQGGA